MTSRPGPSLRGHLAIARVDHWLKNVFVLPGTAVALVLDPNHVTDHIILRVVIGLLATGFVASSNYTLNELLDAPFDAVHPTKHTRPVPTGQVSTPIAIIQWLALGAIGVGLGYRLSHPLGVTLAALWLMGCIYNIPPIRSKDIPYVDVISEAVNNPLRMLAGWHFVSAGGPPPASLLISYWMVGCYFMSVKRFAEVRHIGDPLRVAAYRKSLARFSEEKLQILIAFYASASMLFFGAFIMRYRLELILTFPLVAWVMALYLALGFDTDSAAQHPEKLYRERGLMSAVIICALAMTMLMFVDLPSLRDFFSPVVPVAGAVR